jgi:hypothetical protein
MNSTILYLYYLKKIRGASIVRQKNQAKKEKNQICPIKKKRAKKTGKRKTKRKKRAIKRKKTDRSHPKKPEKEK